MRSDHGLNLFCGLLLAGMAALIPGAALAQGFPAKPITMIVPFAPGGPAEVIARTVAQPMAQHLGQQVIVELKPGAGGNIGSEYVAKQARRDGYTILYGSTSLASNVSLMKLNYDPRQDLVPIAGINMVPNLLIVGPGSPFKSVAELIAAARAKPGAITFGSSGPGTSSHLVAELFKASAGIDILHVPYKGSGAVLADLVAGRVDMLMEVQSSALGRVRSGQVRALATSAPRRANSLPDVPTIAESGFPGFEMGAWGGLFAPAGTPADAMAKLEDATVRSIGSDAVKQQFEQMSAISIPESAAAFAKYFTADIERWAKLVREGHLKPLQ